MTVTEERTYGAVTQPGIYDMPEQVYHADPVPSGSLSSSGARDLVGEEGCPAKFRYEQDHKRPHKKVFELGTAAHKQVLGVGPNLVVVDAPRWDTNELKARVAQIREDGGVPLKAHEYEQVQAMAKALREHPIAGKLFQPGAGAAEQSLFWTDRDTGVNCRARLDWLMVREGSRPIAVDYKTTASAAPDKIRKAVYDYGYFQQDPWYLDGVKELVPGGEDAGFVFIFQEKTPPFVVTVIELDTVARRIGRILNRQARELYARCMSEGTWPAYSNEIELLPLPEWAERKYEENL